MTQRRLRNRNDFNQSEQQIIVKMLHWTLVVLMVFQQLKTTAAVKFKGDNCFTKNKPGICKEWSECPIIKTLIDSGEYTNQEVVSCGFGIREELICCPVGTETKIETPDNKNDDPSGDRSTTAVPDFWLDLLTPQTTPTSSTTTTLKPLIVGKQKLNESSEFFDFNALLSGNQNGRNKQQRQMVHGESASDSADLTAHGSERGNNFNTGPANLNQWGRDQPSNSFNNGPSVANFNNGPPQFVGNGNENFAWGQQNNGRGPINGNSNFHRDHNMGRGPHNHNNANFNGRNNNGRVQNSWGWENQNQGFASPQNNMRPNDFFGKQRELSSHIPGRPVNNMQEQNPNLTGFHNENKPNGVQINNSNKSDDKKVEDLIKNVFASTNFGQENSDEEVIANIFNLNKPQNPLFNNPQNSNNQQPVVWLTPQRNNNNHNKHQEAFVQFPTMNRQPQLTNPQVPGHFEIIPAADNQINANDLEVAPSTNFIQQPVVVQTWSPNTAPTEGFDPVQVVYQNLVNSGMDIVKAEENQLPTAFNPQPSQVFVLQPQMPVQQTPQIIYQPHQGVQNFGVQNSQPLQMESTVKGPRSTSSSQQFVQQPDTNPIFNVQSPPKQILDPFKPFEFRPPLAEANNFSEDNNSLSDKPIVWPDPKPSNNDRPAVRACNRIENGLNASLTQHILGGTPAELGEFPHMVAIGYSRIGGDDRPPYDIRCGGTLIDRRFVLTAAHCVSERDSVPSIVRLGVVNFKSAKQMSAAVEVRIKKTHIHDEYRSRLTYNDIAILELERDVEYSEYIYPVCLYTDLKDPDPEIKLWVTGWGTVNTTTRSFSDILLKAPLHTAPIEKCNKSFTDYGLNRRIPEGIIRTQFCAEDKDQIKDACQGDSGGPLNLIKDESYNNYRLVGVVSSGFGCASSTPGLYTRVAAFLDYIEKIVWPNGGD